MRVALTRRAKECLAELQEACGCLSVREIVEGALWGSEGPGRELTEREWDEALGRDRWAFLRERGTRADTIPATEVVGWLRARTAEREEDEEQLAAVYLGEDASRHVELFVRAGVYGSAEEAVEAALSAAVLFRVQLPDPTVERW